jgi:hypothetical protein
MQLRLSSDQIRVLADAINWTLNVEFHRSPHSAFRDSEVDLLNLIFRQLCFAFHGNREVRFEDNQLQIASETPHNREAVHNVIRCLHAFDAEVGHSPNEVQVITGVPISVLKSLLGNLGQFVSASA